MLSMVNWLSYRQLGRFPIFVCDVVYHYPWKSYYTEVLHEKNRLSFYLTCEVSLPDEDNALQKQFVE